VDRLAIAYERVWDAFQRSQSTADGRHDTPYWRAHSGPYAACVVRVPAEALQPKLTIVRRQLSELRGVRLHPDHFLHIMLQELGGVNSFQDAVFLDVGGGSPLSRLHERFFDLAALPTLPSYSYLPHCTIAHYDGTTPHDEAQALIAPWRHELIGEFAIAEAEIVTLDPNEPYPELATYAVIPFGG
jgi:hypothetical protein